MARINIIMKIEGGEQLRKALLKIEPAFHEEMARALPEEGNALLAAANASAPRASGELASTGAVSESVNERRVKVAVAYLDPKAAAVHEGFHWGRFHQGTHGFQWFLKALHSFEAGFTQRIAARLRALIGGGS